MEIFPTPRLSFPQNQIIRELGKLDEQQIISEVAKTWQDVRKLSRELGKSARERGTNREKFRFLIKSAFAALFRLLNRTS